LNNYKITIEYCGINFLGWQKQKNTKNTIQETIEDSFSRILDENIKLTAAGRTDTGVNALNQTANFKTDKTFNSEKILYSLNSILPRTITIKDIKKVKENFHSRYSAIKREYFYQITLKKRAICSEYFYKLNYLLDYSKIDRFLHLLKGDNIFKSLCKNINDKHNFRCFVFDIHYKLRKSKNELIFSITANRFLHSMVRAIVGCALDIGRGKLDFEETKRKFLKGEKIKTTYLPGNALFLKKIYY